MTDDLEAKCKELCSQCAAGVVVRFRTDTREWVHDWSFGGIDPKTGLQVGRGHGICAANDLRKQNGQ